jgi:valyl-tRNA synthetase
MSTADTARELAKTYDPAAVEAEAYRVWTDEHCFAGDPARPGEPFSIVIPPPNVTGALHLGHAINNTLQDILVRQHRMAGFNTVWIPGIDHAGIATQAVVEKQLKEKENLTRHDVGREGLVERIWAWKQQYGDRILSQLQRLGCSCDWGRTRFTLDEMCARAVRETFFKLFKDGLVYRGKRLVNWDVHLQTSISDDEIYHEHVKTFLWHINYRIVKDGFTTETRRHGEEGDKTDSSASSELNSPCLRVSVVDLSSRPTHMTVATTRPETLLGDTAVAVHSQDPRWNWAIGLQVELPLTGRRIPIIADDVLVDPAFGSGVVKVTPAHDPNDYAVYQRHLGQPDAIEIINLMNPDGTLNAAAGPKYAGLTMAAARKAVVADLGDALVKEEPYETQVGHSDRSKTAIQPYLSDQWFVKMAPLAEPALEVVRDGTIKFFPERHAHQYLSWLGEKRDWPISRQLWWGHRIPVWHFAATVALWEEEERQFLEKLQVMTAAGRVWEQRPSTGGASDKLWYCVRGSDDREAIALLERHGYRQDEDVLDTWFSSALWPHSTLGWPERTADLAKWYPTSVLMTGRDIITLWVARMVMMGMYNMGKDEHRTSNVERTTSKEENAEGDTSLRRSMLDVGGSMFAPSGIPFRHVAINPTILDGKGERMSKSKGNGVDPVDIIDTHGADALRFTLTTMATETQDVRLPVKKDAQGRNGSDKFDLGRNFCTKLWNAAKFALANLAAADEPRQSRGLTDGDSAAVPPLAPGSPGGVAVDESKWSLPDRWIVSRFNRTLATANDALAIYRFDQYAKACYEFFWDDFCAWYVEASKPAMKDPARAAPTAHVLASVLDGVLRLMHPMIPFITETLWWKLNEVRPARGLPGRLECPPSARLIHAAWPAPGTTDDAAEHIFTKLQEVIVAIRNLRNEYKADPKKPVTVSITADAEPQLQLLANREMIELLATCTLARVEPTFPPPPHSARASAAGRDIYVEGLIDPAAEGQRVAKLVEQKQKQAAALRGRLANPSYADKAPAHLVQQTRDELAAVEAELAKLG